MGEKGVPTLRRQPGAYVKSLVESFRFDRARARQFPIVVGRGTEVRRDPTSRLELGGRLFVGHWPEDEEKEPFGVGPGQTQRSILSLSKSSRLSTSGWAILGPGVQTMVGPDAEVRIGGGTYITANSLILCWKDIEIGSDCAISWGVTIMDSDAHLISKEGGPRDFIRPIRIGNHVWVASNVTILKGVTIGDDAVVAAGSVVAGDVPPGAMVGGVPARVIKPQVKWA